MAGELPIYSTHLQAVTERRDIEFLRVDAFLHIRILKVFKKMLKNGQICTKCKS